ncbi:hypothetical protein NLG97_g10158 [Lecanicillium saksenae]|uniref:Uncharacterized protein n=1 Tax=Lecanicillium saksenae TaxID=468837 RepID=A0ACC1QH69_9HYPO|nr:hypothetical protein NLG97_g10158 [Lecanicillium saksenae]
MLHFFSRPRPRASSSLSSSPIDTERRRFRSLSYLDRAAQPWRGRYYDGKLLPGLCPRGRRRRRRFHPRGRLVDEVLVAARRREREVGHMREDLGDEVDDGRLEEVRGADANLKRQDAVRHALAHGRGRLVAHLLHHPLQTGLLYGLVVPIVPLDDAVQRGV